MAGEKLSMRQAGGLAFGILRKDTTIGGKKLSEKNYWITTINYQGETSNETGAWLGGLAFGILSEEKNYQGKNYRRKTIGEKLLEKNYRGEPIN